MKLVDIFFFVSPPILNQSNYTSAGKTVSICRQTSTESAGEYTDPMTNTAK